MGGVVPDVPLEVEGDDGSVVVPVDGGGAVDGRTECKVGVGVTPPGMTTAAFGLVCNVCFACLNPGGTGDVPVGPPGETVEDV